MNVHKRGGKPINRYITNHQIRAKQVRVINTDGSQVGVVSIEEGIKTAENQGLDLLLISPDTDPPVCKIVDLGQHKYEQSKKNKNAKKSKAQVIKEIKLSPKISENDLQTKVKLGKKFLTKSYQIKLSVFFKGRENARKEMGVVVMQKYLDEIGDLGTQQGEIAAGHRSLYIIIQPNKQ